jgi:(1->4)-alpha-D-glucan 1-alpha-D-glucosylmutase
LIGAWPGSQANSDNFMARLKDYLIKAVREAKVHTEWLKPDLAYEVAYMRFVEAIMAPESEFFAELKSWSDRLTSCAIVNALARTVLKVAAPGVPDFYQGTELWDLSFVDPDNRRPVDFAARRPLLAEITRAQSEDRAALLARLLGTPEDGAIKVYVIYKALELRRSAPELFSSGEYLALASSGAPAEHMCAFARRSGDAWVIALAPRLLANLALDKSLENFASIWEEGELQLPADAPSYWVDAFTGAELRARDSAGGKALACADLLGHFPVALLSAAEPARGTSVRFVDVEHETGTVVHGG